VNTEDPKRQHYLSHLSDNMNYQPRSQNTTVSTDDPNRQQYLSHLSGNMNYQSSLADGNVSLANNKANRNDQRYVTVSNSYLGNATKTRVQGPVFANETDSIIDEACNRTASAIPEHSNNGGQLFLSISLIKVEVLVGKAQSIAQISQIYVTQLLKLWVL